MSKLSRLAMVFLGLPLALAFNLTSLPASAAPNSAANDTAPNDAPNDTPALASDPNFSCTDIKIVFARHSGADLGERNYQAYVQAFQDTFSGTGLSLSAYELGTHPGGYNGYSYPSPGIGLQTWERFTTTLGAVVSAGNSYAFGESVKTGAAEAEYFISNYKRLCPASKLILGGYSQGAQVVSLALQKLNPSDVFQAHTFGDPKLYLPEGTPSGTKTSSRACREGRSTYSHYRTFVPDCYVFEGVLGGYRPYDPYLSAVPEKTPAASVPLATPALSASSPYLGKIKAYCQHHDVICSSYVDLAHFAYGHATYLEQGAYKKAAEEVYNAVFPPAPGDSPNFEKPIQNVALLIDNTDSMNSQLAYYRSTILQVAKKYLESGAKLALYTFRDLATAPDPSSPYFDTPRLLCNFETCSLDTLPDLLDSIYFTSGGDDPESVLSSAYTLMNQLTWTPGANKSVIVFTDASFHSPDLDGITIDDVVTLSEKIDPVNLYFFVPAWEMTTYRELADRTAGGVYKLGTLDSFLALNQEIADRLGDTDLFLSAPDLEQSEITSLSVSEPDWYDLTRNNLPTAEEERKKIKKLSFSASENTVRVILTINEEISGYYDLLTYLSDSFILSDLDLSQETRVCLSPISSKAYRSASKCIILGADKTPDPSDEPDAPDAPDTPSSPSADDNPNDTSFDQGVTTPNSSGDIIIIPKAPNTALSREIKSKIK